MSLLAELPLLDGWEYDIREIPSAPVPLTAQRPLIETLEGRGWVLYMLAVSTDPQMQVIIKADSKENKFRVSELANGMAAGNVAGGITVPSYGMPAPPFGQFYSVFFQGFNSPLPYRSNVSVTVRTSGNVANPQLISWVVDLVRINDPQAFRESYRQLHSYPPIQAFPATGRVP